MWCHVLNGTRGAVRGRRLLLKINGMNVTIIDNNN
jgi:hypothetical protein